MSDVAIRVENLSKQYRIGGPQASYKTLRESLVGAVQSPVRRVGRLLRGEAATDHRETIWALKDVSFEVKHGEVLGIIGRNGAGKSTLLKILSRITLPTEGTVDLYGRVGSLLEVGTGFHPELTGRENVYLNGAILGMKRAEIDQKFDEIVAFAELEKFLDTPVKHYSSGMYVRLAFAVAAHLDPEILLVDEVLAVGDAAFQKKCLGKMGEVAGEGRTVLFVSHHMNAISTLCGSCIWLDNGRTRAILPAIKAVQDYLSDGISRDAVITFDLDEGKPAQCLYLRILDVDFHPSTQFLFEEEIVVEYGFLVRRKLSGMYLACIVYAYDGTQLLVSYSFDSPGSRVDFSPGEHRARFALPGGVFAPGQYSLSPVIGVDPVGRVHPNHEGRCSFVVEDLSGVRGSRRKGLVALRLPWIQA